MAKLHYRVNLWTCGLCGKSFYREPYLDLHMAKSHYDQTSNVSVFSFYFFYILNTIKFPYTYEKKIYSIVLRINSSWQTQFWMAINQAWFLPLVAALSQKRTKYVFSCFFFDSVLSADLFFLVGNYTNSLSLKKYFCFQKAHIYSIFKKATSV